MRPHDSVPRSEEVKDLSLMADDQLRFLRRGRPLIVMDRNTSVGRVSYTGPSPIESARPTLALGCYHPWSPAQPVHTLAAEHRDPTISRPIRSWWHLVHQEATRRIDGDPRPPILTAWVADHQNQTLLGPRGTFVGMPTKTNDLIENKSELSRILTQAQVDPALMIPARTYHDRLPILAHLRKAVGSDRLVIQTSHGAGGRGTVFVEEEADLNRVPTQGPWRVSQFVRGWSSNTTVLSIPDGRGGVDIYIDRPSHKAIGLSEVGIASAKSAGNDWSRTFPEEGVSALFEAIHHIGRWAWNEHRMSGMWGVDTMWTPDGRPHINEINARRQGTTEVSGANQYLTGQPPLSVAHLVSALGGRPEWLPAPEDFNTTSLRSVTTPGSWAPYYLKIRSKETVKVSRNFPGSGIYRLTSAQSLVWEKPGAHPAQANSDIGQVLLANTPAPGALCAPGAELATVEGVTTGNASPFAGPFALSDRGHLLLTSFLRHLRQS